MNPDWTIRDMTESDLVSVLGIEQVSFASPWSRNAFAAELRRPGGLCLVAERGFEPIGYAVAWRVADEIHIANLAVHPDRQRRGVAESLMNVLLARCSGAVWAGLEVRESNTRARRLYRKLGFREDGIRKGYYAEEGEDAVLMSKPLGPRPRGAVSPVLDATALTGGNADK
jgi:ribosomal-protein-alanine N-acetyltransferase